MRMHSDFDPVRLRRVLRDLVALSAVPAVWLGREPHAIAAGLADLLTEWLQLDFAFVRLRDRNGSAAVESARGNAWPPLLESLQRDLADGGRLSCSEIVPGTSAGTQGGRGIVIPVGVNAEAGIVAAACTRPDFPDEIDQLLLSVAANHAATAFRMASLVDDHLRTQAALRDSERQLETKVAERTAELRRSEAYLAEAQRLSHTGSFGWKPDSGEIVWSDETYRIFEYDPAVKPTIDSMVQRVHPYDRALVQQIIDRASQAGTDFEHEYRLLLADGRVKHVHAIAHATRDKAGRLEYVGAAQDVTRHRLAEAQRKEAAEALQASERDLRSIICAIPTMVWSTAPDGSVDFFN